MKLNFPLGDTHFKKSDWDDYQLLQYSGDTEIQTVRLDDYDTDEVGLIKLDIQGHEYAALQGAKQTILHDHPNILIEMEKWDTNTSKIEALLADWDYDLVFRKNADRIYVWQGW